MKSSRFVIAAALALAAGAGGWVWTHRAPPPPPPPAPPAPSIPAPVASSNLTAPALENPIRDVDIEYKPVGADAPKIILPARIRYSAKAKIERLDMQGGGWIFKDFANQLLIFGNDDKKIAAAMPATPGMAHTTMLGVSHWQNQGTAQYAGLACTKWQQINKDGPGMTQCFSDDGVLLHSQDGHGVVLMDAQSVTYAPQPDALFVVPAGYEYKKIMRMTH